MRKHIEEKSLAILNALPYSDDVIETALDIAMIRGFEPLGISETKFRGESLFVEILYKLYGNITQTTIIKLSFKKIVKNPEQYLKDIIKQELGRISNDNRIENRIRIKSK